jgi:hypothetical protein
MVCRSTLLIKERETASMLKLSVQLRLKPGIYYSQLGIYILKMDLSN